jgi:hypothetical protein
MMAKRRLVLVWDLVICVAQVMRRSSVMSPGYECLERRNHSFGMDRQMRLLARRLNDLTVCVHVRWRKP